MVVDTKSGLRPVRLAFRLAALYLLICTIIVWTTSSIAAHAAINLEHFHSIEILREIAFVVLSSGALFVVALLLLRQIEHREDKLATQRKALLASERRAVAGIFAASVAHDINNILIVCDFAASRLEAEATSELQKYCVGELLCANERLKDLAARLRAGGREASQSEFRHLNLGWQLKEAVKMANAHAQCRKVTLETECEEDSNLFANPALLHQMLFNLILNAAEAVGAGGHVLVTAGSSSQHALIRVHDDGPGVQDASRERVFDAFYTTKEAGTGLGLLSGKACSEAHGGTIQVGQSPRLGGACFTISIPCHVKTQRPAPNTSEAVKHEEANHEAC